MRSRPVSSAARAKALAMARSRSAYSSPAATIEWTR